eukprot:scaffold28_cov515-Prasinococcus_capsulatus_cf.AAC.7
MRKSRPQAASVSTAESSSRAPAAVCSSSSSRTGLYRHYARVRTLRGGRFGRLADGCGEQVGDDLARGGQIVEEAECLHQPPQRLERRRLLLWLRLRAHTPTPVAKLLG